MAEVVSITARPRDPQRNKGIGTRASRRLRAQGQVPAIVYGHKQDPLPISLARDDVWRLIKLSAHLAELKIDGATETVLVRDVQWDHLCKEIIHLDFSRVSADEAIETEVRLELHGHAPGAAEGGIVEQLVHSITVTCRANAIPDAIRVEIGNLHVHEAVHVRDLTPPEGVTIKADPDQLVVHVVTRAPTAEATPAAEPAPTEPEVIGRKAEDKEEEKDKDKEKK